MCRYETGLFDWLAPTIVKQSGSDQQIRVVISFEGRIDDEIMEKTLHAITYIDPILGCRFIQSDKESYWERQKDIDTQKLLTIIETNDAEKTINRFVCEEVDVYKVPLLRACVVRTPSNDILCLRINHTLADGGGTKELTYLIADTYKKLYENPNLKIEMGEYKPRTIVGLLKKYTDYKIPEDVELPAESGRKFTFPKYYFKLPTKDNGSKYPDFALRRIDPDDFLKLKSFGKNLGSTINDLILAALIRTLSRVSGLPDGAEITLQVSNDIRSALPSNIKYTICNIFGMSFPPFIYHTNEPFEDTLAMVREIMNKTKAEVKNLDNRVKNELIMEKARHSKEGKSLPPMYHNRPDDYTHIILSNLTILDEDKLDFGPSKVTDAYEIGTISYGREFVLSVSTYKNKMTLSTGYCHSNISQKDMDGIMDSIISELFYCINKSKIEY